MSSGRSARPIGMAAPIDHTAAARRMAELVAGVPEPCLGDATPCAEYTVADLLDHIVGVTRGLTLAARKQLDPDSPPPAPGDASRLIADWRAVLPGEVLALAEAWKEPGAFEGQSRAGGLELPTEVVAGVALEELVVHGWDLAMATGQAFAVTPVDLAVTERFLSEFQSPEAPVGGAYAPPLPQPAGATDLAKVIALSGRDPAWTRP
jgi:uncharacterized protein (TIGR03086 family)